jgi:hypothetical protein
MTHLCLVFLFLFQIPNTKAGGTYVQHNPGNDKNPAPSLFAPNNQPNSNTSDSQGEQIPAQYANVTVKMAEVPLIVLDTVDINIILTCLLVVVGFLQVCVLFKQAAIAERQEIQMKDAGKKTDATIAQMKDTAQRELRAYLNVSKIFVDFKDPALPVGCVEVQNFGKTPAYHVRQWAGIAPNIFPLSPNTSWPKADEDGSAAVVPPGGVPYSTLVRMKKPLPDEWTIRHSNPKVIYVFGEITYEDAFGIKRYSKFNYFCGGPEMSIIQTAGGTRRGVMKPYTEGNEAD